MASSPPPLPPLSASLPLTVSSYLLTPLPRVFAAVHPRIPSFVDYVSFCGAVEPKTGGRDLDNQRRVLDKAWKTKPMESRSGGKQRPQSLEAENGDRDGRPESAESVRIHRNHPRPRPPAVFFIHISILLVLRLCGIE